MAQEKIKVLIADDSSVSRDLLSFIIQSDPNLMVVGTAENGQMAVEMASQMNPDVIMMDIVMPKMNGFDATKKIMAANPTPIILVSGVFNKDEITKAFDAIKAGATTIIEKPKGVGDSQYLDTARFVIETIKALSMIKITSSHQKSEGAALLTSKGPMINHTIDVIGIGASIGGPQALSEIISHLPGTFPVPILIVQHISSGFTEGFAKWLSATTSLHVQVAKQGEKIRPGHIYVAPDQQEMTVNRDGIIELKNLEAGHKGRPSINALFESIAKSYGKTGPGLILTGIGTDGVKGLKAIKDKGGITIVQDPKGALLPDLPLHAIESGAATHVETLAKIPITLKLLSQKQNLNNER